MIHFTLRAATRIRCQALNFTLFIVTILTLLGPGYGVAQGSKLRIVTTTGIIADTVSQIGGEYVAVSSLMGEGVDPHLYKASPGDMKRLLEADLVFHNGLHLEGKMADALVKLAARKPVFAISQGIPRPQLRSPDNQPDAIDPHIWFSATLWQFVIDEITKVLTQHMPHNKELLLRNSMRLKEEFRTLDTWIKNEISNIPEERRILITAHDAFGYYGAAYGIQVLAIQGMSTDSEASLQEINQLVDTIVSRKIPAVFVESSVPQKTVHALVEGARAKTHQVIVGGELFSDALGASGTEVGTLAGIIRHNTNTIVTALRGEK
jgi:manganese/zinc/iron transport system substrate-binding protein